MKKHIKVFLIGFILVIILFFIPLDYFLIAPGKVFNLKEIVITNSPKEKNHFNAPSVEVFENRYFSYFETKLFNKLNTNLFYFLYSSVHPEVESKKLSEFIKKGTTSEEFESSIQSATNMSIYNIKYLISKKLNLSIGEINLTINLTSEGPSVAIALTLEALNQFSKEDITKGLKIGAVGNIDREGNVYPVNAIKQKILSADKANLDILFIPKKSYDEVMNMKTKIKVIPVSNLDEALDYLKLIVE